ncbi:hypothetical protein PALB_29110 [Pseudoalteromonas luteoviolacea B = ATCC 29581]|nr:hypothetical protein PALB_29110 [Pseudoalteromonas luteoviolacea B = ATCC 29581]
MLTNNGNSHSLFFRRFSLNQPNISECRLIIKHILLKISASASELDGTTLVVVEYLTNLLRHGDGEDSQIGLSLVQNERAEYCLSISDRLSPYNPLEHIPSINFETGELQEGGMGIALLNHYFPNAKYETLKGENTLLLPLKGPSKKKRIVYIDDDPRQLNLVKAYLEKDYDIYIEKDLKSGLQVIYDVQPEVLLLDYELQECTAVEVLEKLNQTSLKCNMAVIILTGTALENAETLTNRLGIDGYLTKPITKSQLNIALERVLYRSIFNNSATNQSTNNDVIYNKNADCKVECFGSVNHRRSGDFSVIVPWQDSLIVVIGDVVGHGDRVANFAAELKGFVSGFLSCTQQPLDLFFELNRAFVEESLSNSHYATLLMVTIQKHQLKIASAGHPLPILIDDLNANEIGSTDMMFGVSAKSQYTFVNIERKSNTRVLLYTDGWFDNRFSGLTAEHCIKEYLKELRAFPNMHFSQALWKVSTPKASQEFDDASLITIEHIQNSHKNN